MHLFLATATVASTLTEALSSLECASNSKLDVWARESSWEGDERGGGRGDSDKAWKGVNRFGGNGDRSADINTNNSTRKDNDINNHSDNDSSNDSHMQKNDISGRDDILYKVVMMTNHCNQLLSEVSDRFKAIMASPSPAPHLIGPDPKFVLAVTNVFFGASDFIRCLSILGMALHRIQRVHMGQYDARYEN